MTNRPAFCRSIALGLLVAAACCSSDVSHRIDRDTSERLGRFIRGLVTDTLEKDYHSHNILIHVAVTDVRIDRVTKRETAQDLVYFVRGLVTYRIEGKRTWKDREGNSIDLGPEQDITHWYTCGVLEDKYLHAFYTDDRHRLTFHADKPAQEDRE